MSKCKYFLISGLFSLMLPVATQAAVSCVPNDCASLGYTKTESECDNGQAMVRCPFDTSKVVCRPSMSTPIFDMVREILYTTAASDSLDYITLETELDGLCGGRWATKCASSFCDALNEASNKKVTCDSSNSTDLSNIKGTDSVGGLVNWIEIQLLTGGDSCSGSVTVDTSLEECTSYCTSDSSKCMAKKTLTCSEAVAKVGGTLLTNANSANLSNNTYYVTTDLTFYSSVTNMSNVTFVKASSLPPCANDATVTKNPKMTFQGSIQNVDNATFYVDADIGTIYISDGDSPTIKIASNVRIKRLYKNSNSSSTGSTDMTTIVLDANAEGEYSVSVGVYCAGINVSECRTQIVPGTGFTATDVLWCNMGSDQGSNNVIVCATGYCHEGEPDYCYY